MIENAHAMFGDLLIERVGVKDRRRIGSLESFDSQRRIQVHVIIRNFWVNVALPVLSYFFHGWPENRGLVRGWMMSRCIHPFVFLRWLEEENRGRPFSNLGKSISEVSKDHKGKLGLAPNLFKRSTWPLPDGNECR